MTQRRSAISRSALLGHAQRDEHDVPTWFGEAAAAAFVPRSMDAELAATTYDSQAQRAATRAARSEFATIREITFSTRKLTIHIEITSTVLHGTVVPPQRGRLEVQSAGRAGQVVNIDEQGWFSAAVPRQWFRLICRTEAGDNVVTDRLTI